MNWISLTEPEQLQKIIDDSGQKPQIVYKHSSRCGISSMVLRRLERESPPDSLDYYFVDVIRNRNVSNKIAEQFNVYHESPQILVIKNGECIYDESHYAISMEDVLQQLNI